jgi:glutamine amidotransferase
LVNTKVTIIDYGLGNLLSVKRAFEYLGVEVEITDSPTKIQKADRLIIPGVGAFPRGMEELENRNLVESIKTFNTFERPIFAICLGMQLLMEFGEEHQKTAGLNLINGNVIKFPSHEGGISKTKIPHIGWGELKFNSKNNKYEKFKSFQDKQMYFVHSYYVDLANQSNLLATTKNEVFEFCSVISSKNIIGCQFHPEKSGQVGLTLIKEFMDL